MEPTVLSNPSIFEDIQGIFDEESPCENANHNDDPNHGGPGQWYLTSKPCQHCGNLKPVRLVCDSFAQYLIGGGPIGCGKCKRLLGHGLGAYQSITRKA